MEMIYFPRRYQRVLRVRKEDLPDDTDPPLRKPSFLMADVRYFLLSSVTILDTRPPSRNAQRYNN